MPAADPDKLAQQVAPALFTPPNPRELRAQSVKRLQVGLFGLAMMLLLVALANIIMDRARLAELSGGAAASAVSSGSSAADPLADLGVVPSPDAGVGHKRNQPGNR